MMKKKTCGVKPSQPSLNDTSNKQTKVLSWEILKLKCCGVESLVDGNLA